MRLSSLKFPMTTVPWEPGKIFQQVGTVLLAYNLPNIESITSSCSKFPLTVQPFTLSFSLLCRSPIPSPGSYEENILGCLHQWKRHHQELGVQRLQMFCKHPLQLLNKKNFQGFVLCIPAFKGCAKAPGLVLLRIPGDKQGILNQTSNSGYFLYVSF